MKKVVFASLFLLTSISFSSQALVHEGSEWIIDYDFGKTISAMEGFAHLQYNGDTIINDTLAHIITSTIYNLTLETATLAPYLTEYIYTTDDAVYRLYEGEFRLVYDLNAQVGDVFVNYGTYCNWEISESIVDSVGVVTIDGMELRYLHLNHVMPGFNNVEFRGIIVERIGAFPLPTYNSGYLFPQDACIIDGPLYIQVRCYQDNEIEIVRDDVIGDCGFGITNGIDVLSTTNIEIFPNPSTGIFQINAPPNFIRSIELYNDLGQGISLNRLVNSTATELNLEQLSSGFYIVKFKTHNGKNLIKKLVKL